MLLHVDLGLTRAACQDVAICPVPNMKCWWHQCGYHINFNHSRQAIGLEKRIVEQAYQGMHQ